MDNVAPGDEVSSQSRPLAMVNVTGTKGLLQGVLVSLLWRPSVTVANRKFSIQGYFG